MEFCCGVTLYYPSHEELELVNNYGEIFDKVYLFDNTDSKDRLRNESYFSNKKKFVYISNCDNDGLSKAFNIMCRKAISEAFDFICLFDQDSYISNKDLSYMIEYVRNYYNRNVALFVPEINFSHKGNDKKQKKEENKIEEVTWAISSGSFINLEVYGKTKGFDENYFIDRLDYDYCYEVRKLGYKIMKFNNIFLLQKLGEQGAGIFKGVSQHNAIRHYYIFRNRLYFYLSKNQEIKPNKFKMMVISLKHILIIILLENKKVTKLKMIFKGLQHFQQGKMGKYVDD